MRDASGPRPSPGAPTGQAGDDTVARVSLGAVCVVPDPDGRVLLVRHTYDRRNWELPGGRAEAREDPLRTGLRELGEETGIAATDGTLTGLYLEPGHELGPMLHAVVRVAWTPVMRPMPSSPEIDEVRWCDPAALPGPISDFTARRITDALASPPPVVATIGARHWSDGGMAASATRPVSTGRRPSKLVRDRIPELPWPEGPAAFHVADDAEYVAALRAKLAEEVAEWSATTMGDGADLEELADILEVLHALAALAGSSVADLEARRAAKARLRGGFLRRIILEGSESDQ